MKEQCERGVCQNEGASSFVPLQARTITHPNPFAGSFGCDFTQVPRSAGKLGRPQKEDEPLIPIGGNGDGKKAATGAATATAKAATAKATPPKLDKATVSGPRADDCGGFKWVVQWKLDKKTTTGGWVVQKVNYSHSVKNCDGKPHPLDASDGLWDPSWVPYWEAWQINKDHDVTTFAETGDTEDDTFEVGSTPDTKGNLKITGSAQFYDGLTLPASMKATHAAPAWDLPTTKSAPKLTGGTGAIDHSIKAKWNCCKDSKSKTTEL